MSASLLFALGSALAYGLSDFAGGYLSRRTSAWGVAVVAQVSSALCTATAALFVTGSPAAVDFAWAALAGLGSGVGTVFLFRGFASGRMSVVAPVSAVGAALVPVLVGVVTGERPGVLVWIGVVAALPGIWLVSSTPDASGATSSAAGGGLADGILAGLGFGVLFAALGQIPDGSGWWPLTLCQLTSIPAIIVMATAFRQAWQPRGRTVWWALVCGPLAASATGLFLLSTQHGHLTVAGVLTSLYPAVTVLLAALVLHERIHRLQGAGIGLCLVAVALVAGG